MFQSRLGTNWVLNSHERLGLVFGLGLGSNIRLRIDHW